MTPLAALAPMLDQVGLPGRLEVTLGPTDELLELELVEGAGIEILEP